MGLILFYFLVIVLLVAVIFLGVEVKGSKSWFEFGPVRFQPAEISKITTSLLLAYTMSRAGFRLTKSKNFITVAGIIILPMLIILAESETGSALVYVGLIFMLYREGLSGWLLAMLGLAILTFILTLVASPYTAILVLMGIISVCSALNTRKIVQWIAISAVCITALYFLRDAWTALQAAKGDEIPGSDGNPSGIHSGRHFRSHSSVHTLAFLQKEEQLRAGLDIGLRRRRVPGVFRRYYFQ